MFSDVLYSSLNLKLSFVFDFWDYLRCLDEFQAVKMILVFFFIFGKILGKIKIWEIFGKKIFWENFGKTSGSYKIALYKPINIIFIRNSTKKVLFIVNRPNKYTTTTNLHSN
jgi:hypothetical protein